MCTCVCTYVYVVCVRGVVEVVSMDDSLVVLCRLVSWSVGMQATVVEYGFMVVFYVHAYAPAIAHHGRIESNPSLCRVNERG